MAATCILFVTAMYVVLCTFPTGMAGTTPIILEYKPNRPPYAGATGGNWVNYAGQRVPLGTPWPSRPEDYASFSATTGRTTLKNRFGTGTSTDPTEDLSTTTESFIEGTATSVNYDVNDTNLGPVIDKNDSKPDISDTKENEDTNTNSSVDHSATDVQTLTEDKVTQSPKLPIRPPFLGPTGGNLIPQLIPSGTPWPAKPEGSQDYNATTLTPSLYDYINETASVFNGNGTKEIEVMPPQLPVPNRPPFLGPTGGNYLPQLIPPGKPWPARPEDYEGYNLTSQDDGTAPSISNITESIPTKIEVTVPPKLPILSRPQSVPLGLVKPEDREDFNGTSPKKPVVKDETIIFPDDPIVDRKIKVKSNNQNPASNVFSVAFYLGDVNAKNSTKAEKPSLALSVDLNSLKSSGQTGNRKADSIKATEEFLSSEKVSNGDQSKNNYSVWINMKDLVDSSKKSAKINISHKDASEKNTKTKQEIDLKKHMHVETKRNDPFLSIFVNFEDFKNMRTVSSLNGTKKGKSSQNDDNDIKSIFSIIPEEEISINRENMKKD